MKKLKIVKVITNNPLSVIGVCSKYGDCKIIKNNVYIATSSSVKAIKEDIASMMTVGFKVIIVNDYSDEVLKWIRELQTTDMEGQLIRKMLETVKK